jgi:CelD/BcsL family acetyltransferase involved in cellulose biosynthesis
VSGVLSSSEPAAVRRRPAGTGTIVEVRSDAEELRVLVPDWEALAAEAAEPNPFYEHWMLLPALEAYGAGEDFRCIAVWQDGTLAGLFPMRLERRYRGLPLRALRSWRHRNMLLCTPLVRAKSAAGCIAALLQSKLAPVVEFEWISAGGFFYGALTEAVSQDELPWTVTDAYTRALLVRGRDPRERFNSNMKNNLRRWQARLGAHGKLTPVRLGPEDDVVRWTQEFMRLEASGWKGRAGSALECREDDRRFVAEVFSEAFRRERLLITGLDLDGRPLARHCMFTADGGAFTFKIAYDETYASCSPGILAEVDNVRQFMETPRLRWIDSNTAPESKSYGRVWKDRRTIQRIAVGARGAGRVAVAALPLMRLAKRWLPRLRPAQYGQAPEPRRPAGMAAGLAALAGRLRGRLLRSA